MTKTGRPCFYEVVFIDEACKSIMSVVEVSLEEDIMSAFKLTRRLINKKFKSKQSRRSTHSTLQSIIELFRGHRIKPIDNVCNKNTEKRLSKTEAKSYKLMAEEVISAQDLDDIIVDVVWTESNRAVVTINFASHKDVFVEWRRKAVSQFISIQYMNDFI